MGYSISATSGVLVERAVVELPAAVVRGPVARDRAQRRLQREVAPHRRARRVVGHHAPVDVLLRVEEERWHCHVHLFTFIRSRL